MADDKIEDEVLEDADDQQEPSEEDQEESVESPFENRPSVTQIAKLRQERRELREKLEQLESKSDELPNESPLEKWLAENPDEDEDIPRKVLLEENRYNRQFNQKLLEKQRAEDRAERQQQSSQAREQELVQTLSSSEENKFYSRMCKENLTDDQYAALQEDCAGKPTAEVVELIKRYGHWAAIKQGSELDKVALDHLKKKSKQSSKKEPETPETPDDLDFKDFETGGVYDDVGFKPAAFK